MTDQNVRREPQLIVPLDVPNSDHAMNLVHILKDQVRFFKVGFELFTSEGPPIIDRIRLNDVDVFLDLKFHDIPNTVSRACRVAARSGAKLLTVHAAGGPEMIRAAAEGVTEGPADERPLIVAVTVLTSINDGTWQDEMGMGGPVADYIPRFARMAKQAGADGVVASPKDLSIIRETCGNDLVIVTPGVRPTGATTGDQARVATPADAVRDGADYLVVGRPITAADDPPAAAAAILQEMRSSAQ